jgi:hypothetical protein
MPKEYKVLDLKLQGISLKFVDSAISAVNLSAVYDRYARRLAPELHKGLDSSSLSKGTKSINIDFEQVWKVQGF